MPVIELDLLVALVNREDKLHRLASSIFEAAAKRRVKNLAIASSALVEYELILRSKGYSRDDVEDDIEAFTSIRNIGEAYLNSKVILKAIELRRKYLLTYSDSLHAATAILHDGKIISTDKAYIEVKDLQTIDPREVLNHQKRITSYYDQILHTAFIPVSYRILSIQSSHIAYSLDDSIDPENSFNSMKAI
ncbi:MAG: PIN domain-containing protein [Candidatus Bathyarchaeia archaeon]